MIKKNTKIIIEGYKVKDKLIDCLLDGEDQIVNITYVLKKI
jgi:hypothetical protein